jgi:hypothetical protein
MSYIHHAKIQRDNENRRFFRCCCQYKIIETVSVNSLNRHDEILCISCSTKWKIELKYNELTAIEIPS